MFCKERRPTAFLLAVICLSFLAASPALFAQDYDSEKIISFTSDIAVHEDASMTVTETIRVKALGSRIKHGIYRDFPTRYRDRFGNNYVVDFKVERVLKDDLPEAWFFGKMVNGRRVYIGKKNVLLDPGEYTYTITYETNRQLGFFKDFDELYWNVTGNGWAFPVEEATCTVELPRDAARRVLKVGAYTGISGATLKNFETTVDFLGNISFRTTRPLRAGEGFTIVISWPKGYVTEPNVAMKIGYFIRDNASVVAGLIGLLALLGYYLAVWARFGRDPAKGTLIPLYSPPDRFTPQAMRYIMRMGFDNKTFAVTLINMAVKGYLKIIEEGGTYTIEKTGADKSVLDADESLIASLLLGDDKKIELRNENHLIISSAISYLRRLLKRSLEKIYFITNLPYFVTGVMLSGALVFISTAMGSVGKLFVVMALAIMFSVNLLFYKLLKAPTLQGRRVMDKIEGFRMYLSIAEKERLNLLNPPEKTPELFERYLPYALALDVENQWAEQFSDVLAKASVGREAYHPAWYSGAGWSSAAGWSSGVAGFTSSLGSSLSGAISSSSTAPGSTSGGGGFGGGGGSGGGGGGGGGGGW